MRTEKCICNARCIAAMTGTGAQQNAFARLLTIHIADREDSRGGVAS